MSPILEQGTWAINLQFLRTEGTGLCHSDEKQCELPSGPTRAPEGSCGRAEPCVKQRAPTLVRPCEAGRAYARPSTLRSHTPDPEAHMLGRLCSGRLTPSLQDVGQQSEGQAGSLWT